MSEDERPLLVQLREQKAKVAARIAEETDVDAVYHLNAEVAELTQRIADAKAGVPSCRYCGSTAIVAWYTVDERQGIDIERDEDGNLVFEYDGDTSTGEAGPDTEYRCRGCDRSAKTLEYLVGDTDEDEPAGEDAPPSIEALQESCGYDPEGEGSVDALIAYKDALEDAYGSLRERVADVDLLEVMRGWLSTPSMSGADVYEAVASMLAARGMEVYDYDDPANPYAGDGSEA